VAWHERSFQRAAGIADHFVVPSARTADAVVGAGVPAAKVTIIEEGCDHLPAPDEAGAAAIVDGDFLLAVGTREPRKNLGRLIEAYGLARPELPEPWPLVVVGPRGWGDEADLDSVIATGYIDAPVLAALYRRARAFAYVPLMEGFGLPPVEAMHAGTPVVASFAVPSSQDGALLVDALDVDAIAAALVAAATDDAVRRDLVARGTARAKQLTWRAAAEQHLDLWRSVAGG
jgi:glycosyltransferase involved in cell wall biosynthesis